MNLSEAIRLGAMLSSQGFRPGHPTRRCVLEAALEAVRGPGKCYDCLGCVDYVAIRTFWPLVNQRATCPVHCGQSQGGYWDLSSILWHLNDVHRWTRERIADWVATVEAQLEPEPEAPREVAHVAAI